MAIARIIPPKCKAQPKLKVAAYCRVSTRATEQQSSLTAQERYYEEHIKQNPNWVFIDVYSDISSGTRIKGRSKFKSLLLACKRGQIDIILTKSAHRFARNTVDASKTIRMLRKRSIDIYFEQEDMGIPSPRGKSIWSKETLRKILSNEKYKGCVTLQKTFVENYSEHKQVKNIGQLEIYPLTDNHEAIVD